MTEQADDGRDDVILRETVIGRSARSIGKQLRCTAGEVNSALDRVLPKIDNPARLRAIAVDLYDSISSRNLPQTRHRTGRRPGRDAGRKNPRAPRVTPWPGQSGKDRPYTTANCSHSDARRLRKNLSSVAAVCPSAQWHWRGCGRAFTVIETHDLTCSTLNETCQRTMARFERGLHEAGGGLHPGIDRAARAFRPWARGAASRLNRFTDAEGFTVLQTFTESESRRRREATRANGSARGGAPAEGANRRGQTRPAFPQRPFHFRFDAASRAVHRR